MVGAEFIALIDRIPISVATDRLTSALLDFGDGRSVAFSVSTQSVPHQRVHLFGTDGRIELTIPFNHPQDGPVTYLTHDGSSLDGLDAERHTIATHDQYTLLGEAFSRQVRDEKPTTAWLLDAQQNMRIIDATFRAAASGRFEAI